MTRRGDNRRDSKRGQRKLAIGATLPERSLAEWIRYAEAERPPDISIKDGVAHVYSDLALSTMPSLKALTAPQPDDPVVKSELIRNQLRFLWADVAFWKLVAGGETDSWLECFIRAEHGLALPGLSHQAWKQLVKDPARRKQLFEVFEKQEWRWLPVQSTLDSEQVMGELKGKWFHKLIDEYLAAPRIAMTRALASHEFSDAALKAIKAMAARLASDADWCLNKNNRVEFDIPLRNVRGEREVVAMIKGSRQLIPADALHQERGRPVDVAVIERIELLAELRRRKKALSDSAAAEALYKERAGEAILHEVKLESLRKNAAAARQLLLHREHIKVGEFFVQPPGK